MFGTANTLNNIKHAAIFLIAANALIACTTPSNKSQDCFYSTIDTHAEVIDLKPGVNGKIRVILDFEASKLALEDQELGELKNLEIDHDFLVRNNIEIQNKYSVTVSEITKGDCTPIFVSFNHAFE